MSIKQYRQKRDFQVTPEPADDAASSADPRALRFVVQKHQASHLHYDFRLEMDGVLKSWAVPKGPSLNPDDKRLAMHVEDHPMDYRRFEGRIPEGNYGAGTVIVWDEGTLWRDQQQDKAGNERALLKDLEKGKLSFHLRGEKLRGEFKLVRMHGRDMPPNAWLLRKVDDEGASTRDVREQDRSVLSGRSLDDVAEDRAAARWESDREAGADNGESQDWAAQARAIGGREADFPGTLKPQLATLVDDAFDREGWLFEIKWDGYRALGFRADGNRQPRLVSRNGKSLAKRFPAIQDALAGLPCAAVVDGEVTALDEAGNPSFSRIQNPEDNADSIVYYLFDLLYLDGVDIRGTPLAERKALLQRLLADARDDNALLRYSDDVSTEGKAFCRVAAQRGLEGIIAKDGGASYQSGKRTRHWLKIKLEQRQEFVIAGYTPPRGSRTDIGSLILGYYDEAGDLRFAGHVGTGMDQDARADLKRRLDRLRRKTSPFKEAVDTRENPAWATPKLVCEVRFTEKTESGHLRHPVYLGLRDDKPADAIRWEVEEDADVDARQAEGEGQGQEKGRAKGKEKGKAKGKAKGKDTKREAANQKDQGKDQGKEKGKKAANKSRRKADKQAAKQTATATSGSELQAGEHRVPVSHPRRVYYPEAGYTKRDVIDFYLRIAPWLLPHMKDRPQVLHRFPQGVDSKGFYQKDNPQDLPEWVDSVPIHSESNDEDIRYLLCQNEATLAYLVNLGCLELNPWSSRVGSLDCPDWMIFDLDPVEIEFKKVVDVALLIHEMLEDAGIAHYCKTSGKRGLHVAVPMGARYSNATVREMAHAIARLVHDQAPSITSLERSPSRRRKKVYLDYLQNGFGKTLAAAYSLRPVDYAGVSTPLRWDEVNHQLDPRHFTLDNLPRRLEQVGDLWEPVLGEGVDLEKVLGDLADAGG